MVKTAKRVQPLEKLAWVDPADLRANNYNPNRVFPPEMELLKLSIMETGWTQPIVATPDGQIIDGFHRWTLASTDADVRALAGGKVPVVYVEVDVSHQMIATVRHNRARGTHGILKMGNIVRTLRDQGLTDADILRRLGMEDEELDRLAETRGSPDLVGKDSFGEGWIPDAGS